MKGRACRDRARGDRARARAGPRRPARRRAGGVSGRGRTGRARRSTRTWASTRSPRSCAGPSSRSAHQAAAIALAPVQSTPASEREDYALLVPCAPGPYTANTPADLLFDARHVTLHRWYVDPAGERSAAAAPRRGVRRDRRVGRGGAASGRGRAVRRDERAAGAEPARADRAAGPRAVRRDVRRRAALPRRHDDADRARPLRRRRASRCRTSCGRSVRTAATG